MPDSPSNQTVPRPTHCPACKGTVFDTLAKVITETTMWRCRQCEETWTIKSVAASLPRPR